MGKNGRGQVEHIEEVGYRYSRGQDMLYQIRPESYSSTIARRDRRSKGTWSLAILNRSANFRGQRPEQNEISLALVPRDHPLIPPPKLEPEASGLLDRLLNIFHEKDRYVF